MILPTMQPVRSHQAGLLHCSHGLRTYWHILLVVEAHLGRYVLSPSRPTLPQTSVTASDQLRGHVEPNTTSAAVSAALVANLVVFAYIIVALREDASDRKVTKKD